MISSRSAAFEPPVGGGGDSGNAFVSGDGRFVLFSSAANNLAAASVSDAFPSRVPAPLNVFLRDRTNQTTTLVSLNFAGTAGGNGDSVCTALSTNGRYGLFESTASDLVINDTNNASDIFVRDLVAGTTILVSASTNGGFGNRNSRDAVMTPDGRYVAFVSSANNLVPGDTNGIADVFVRDLLTGTTALASPGATRAGLLFLRDSSSDAPQITPDGRFVVFLSSATNLVSGITNLGEVYLWDRTGGTTVCVSTGAHAVLTTPLLCGNPVVSDDGQFVAFQANATDLVDARGVVFRYDRLADTVEPVAINPPVMNTAYRYARTFDMTSDGQFIAYIGETDTGSNTYTSQVFLWNGQTKATTLVSASLDGVLQTNSECRWPVIDAGVQTISFFSSATNLTTNGVFGGELHLYVRDLTAGTTKLVDVGTNGVGLAKSIGETAGVTPDGRFIAFDCSDSDLVAGDHNQASDVFLRDLKSGTTELISARSPALPCISAAGNSGTSPKGWALQDPYVGVAPISVSADGRYIAFASDASDLAFNATNGVRQVFVRDLLTGTNILVSVDTNGIAPGSGPSVTPILSPDGRYVAFCSSADNLVPGDTNRVKDVFIRDLAAGTTKLVSVSLNGFNPGNKPSLLLAMSDFGQYVLFTSTAGNLATNAPSGVLNVFFRDMQSGTTTALTTSGVVYYPSQPPARMSRDGHWVAFAGYQPSLSYPLYLWNSQSGTKTQILNSGAPAATAISPDNHWLAHEDQRYGFRLYDIVAKTNFVFSIRPSSTHYYRPAVQFSESGQFLVYVTGASNSISDTNISVFSDLYVYDLAAGTNQLISQNFSSGYSPNGLSDAAVISGDGRYVVYRSEARNIVPGVTNGPQTYLYDRQTGTTTVVANSVIDGGIANHRAQVPVFSRDSQSLVFRSMAPDFVFLDFNQHADVFSWRLASTNPTPVFSAQMVFAPSSGKSPTLTWPAVTGKTYQVQFKDNLSDPFWQPIVGTVTIVGDRGYATDLAPSPAQRFYRIRAY